MLDGLVLVTVAVVTVCWLAGHGAPATRSRRCLLQERRDHLRAHPELVNRLDVELLLADALRADARPGARAADVSRRARAARIPAPVLWAWCERYDAELLALAVEAGLTGEDLAGYLASGDLPDRHTLEMLAAFRGAAAS